MNLYRATQSRLNNFDIIRLFAALLVLASHSFALTGMADGMKQYTFGLPGGDTGVAIFFVISGFLITGSLERRSGLEYFASRALRIYPALIVLSVVSVFLIGPLFTNISIGAYFTTSDTWGYLWNAFAYTTRFLLPGVFVGNPAGPTVNGSLWTLPIEAACYVLLAGLAWAGIFSALRLLIASVVLAFAMLIAVQGFDLGMGNQGWTVFAITGLYPLMRYGLFFLIGATMWKARALIQLNDKVAFVLFLLLIQGGIFRENLDLLLYVCLPYLVIYAAYRRPFLQWWPKRVGDISYGTYLWAFPIQQSLVTIFGPGIGGWWLNLIAIPLVMAIGWLSWTYVENPALQLRHQLKSRRQSSLAMA